MICELLDRSFFICRIQNPYKIGDNPLDLPLDPTIENLIMTFSTNITQTN